MPKLITLGEFIIERQSDFPYAKGELSRLLSNIRLAAKRINREVTKAGLVDIFGTSGAENKTGDDQQKLDVYANDMFIESFRAGSEICAVASEELEDIVQLDSETARNGRYVCCIDPLDGSSNIDVNVSIGTIFSIFRKKTPIGEPATKEDFLQPGTEQVAAGYVIYGSSAMLVYTTGNGVNGFTLDPSIGVFILSHPKMQTPKSGIIYSINEGNYVHFPNGIKKYIKYCQEKDDATNRPYTSRYIGSLVSDFHRNLIKGGIYLYPKTAKSPNGKLRLLYEANPLAFLAEQAGGIASDGFGRIMDIQPTDIHERVPLVIGSPEMVEKAQQFQAEFDNVPEAQS